MGIVAALSQPSTPTAFAPALAYSSLSLLYSTVAVILGFIWIPQAMTSERGSLSLRLDENLPIADAVLSALVGLTVSLQQSRRAHQLRFLSERKDLCVTAGRTLQSSALLEPSKRAL